MGAPYGSKSKASFLFPTRTVAPMRPTSFCSMPPILSPVFSGLHTAMTTCPQAHSAPALPITAPDINSKNFSDIAVNRSTAGPAAQRLN
ncbi:uncharacterized protein M421DRAFT_422028 [Didymella exigua CBS 183.55]|uniref:Uncharacterized protein n=1 Tax=Didymella exigua CBS 183.55 TaxID=1150837 RepID=A0A6A5RI42_9PLEO|nr:uncharacterized protein M421DRAFT_422028 [Didymella exigua CBS 183.55]KAF1927163.1 hypothetical protein M421DRAFT_422028 [Didymella exigua CBS 183.55]